MRTIIWFIKAVLYLVFSIPTMRRTAALKESGDMETFYKTADAKVQHWAQQMLKNAGVTVEVHGKENITGKPAIFVANHQSNWDIPVLLGCLDNAHGIVAKDSMQKIPIVRTWMEYIDCVFLDRNDPRQALRTLNEAGSVIPKGRSISIFPEGTRSRGENVGEFKSGAFKTAFKYHAPIIPVSIDGTYKIMEANGNKWIKPAHVILTILPEIDTEGMDRTRQKALGEEIREMIIKAREYSRNSYKRNDL